MEYIEKKFDEETRSIAEYNYSVTYNKEYLLEIQEKLKNYKYISFDTIGLAKDKKVFGFIGRDTIKERVISYFNGKKIHSNDKIYPETISYNKNDTSGLAFVEYFFEKVPDLYHYIDIIINNKDIISYLDLFDMSVRGRVDMSYAINNRDQVLLNGILGYIDSEELDSNHLNGKCDYKELYKLYKETLACFNFRLTSIKKYYINEPIDGLSFQKKLCKDQ